MENLAKMDGLFGKSDPYFTLNRSREDGKTVVVYKSTVIKKTLNPSFPSFQIQSQQLCNCDPYRPIIICVYDWDKSSSDDLIGRVQTNLNELRTKPQNLYIKRSKANKTYGLLNVQSFSSKALPTFLDYMNGQAEISLCVAVDVESFIFFDSRGNYSFFVDSSLVRMAIQRTLKACTIFTLANRRNIRPRSDKSEILCPFMISIKSSQSGMCGNVCWVL